MSARPTAAPRTRPVVHPRICPTFRIVSPFTFGHAASGGDGPRFADSLHAATPRGAPPMNRLSQTLDHLPLFTARPLRCSPRWRAWGTILLLALLPAILGTVLL